MSDRCAYILLKIVVGIGLLLVFAGFISQKAFADAPQSPAVDSPATQPAVEKEIPSGPASKTDAIPFGKKSGDSPLGTLHNTGPDTSALLRQMLALVVVIGALGFACWFVLKKGLPRFRIAGPARPREITVLETTHLPSRQTLYLMQVGSKKLLLAGGRDGLEMLADVTDGFPEQPTDENFQSVLSHKHTDGSEGQA